MTARSRSADRLRDDFQAIALQLGITTADASLAAAAVREVAERALPSMSFAPAMTPYFAGHDANHPTRLLSLVGELLRTAPPASDSPLRRTPALVLLACALILHDIGMSQLAQEHDSLPLEEVWKGHAVRPKHDIQSLRFIETLELETLHEWAAYWTSISEGPTPHGKWEMMLLARVCQSHGDPEDIWLTEGSLDEYISPSGARASFPALWQSAWPAMEAAAYAAAAILSLADLCDICPERFPSPRTDAALKRMVPADRRAARSSFFHWMGHRVGRVHFSEEWAEYRVGVHPEDSVLAEIAGGLGAGADLLSWGNRQPLRETLQRVAKIPYRGARLALSSADGDAWREVGVEAWREPLRSVWPSADKNSKLLRVRRKGTLGATVAPHWWLLVAARLQEQADELGMPYQLQTLLRLREEGYTIEALLKETRGTAHSKRESSVTVVRVRGNTTGDGQLGDGLLAAMAVVREIVAAKVAPGDARPRVVLFASKGSDLHKALRECSFGTLSGVIALLCPFGTTAPDARDYARMAQRLATRSGQGPWVVCFGFSNEDISLLERCGATVRQFSPSRTAVRTLQRELPGSETGATITSPASLLFRVALAKDLAEGPATTLVRMLEGDKSAGLGVALVAVATLRELLRVDRSSPDGRDLAEALEELLPVVLRALPLNDQAPDASDALRTATTMGLLGKGADGSGRVPNVGALLEDVARRSTIGCLVQLVTFYWVLATERPYAPESSLFESTLSIGVTEGLVNAMFDRRYPLAVRTLVGLGVAERLAKGCERSAHHVARLMGMIAERCTNLRCESDFLAFQISYRLGRALIQNEMLSSAGLGRLQALDSGVVTVGLLEAVGSEIAKQIAASQALVDSQNLRSRLEEKALELLSRLPAPAEEAIDSGFLAMMSYDVVWRYWSAAPQPDPVRKYLARGADLGWAVVAAYFHDETQRDAGGDPRLAARWKRMRLGFLRVLDEAPEALRREKLPTTLRDRVMN